MVDIQTDIKLPFEYKKIQADTNFTKLIITLNDGTIKEYKTLEDENPTKAIRRIFFEKEEKEPDTDNNPKQEAIEKNTDTEINLTKKLSSAYIPVIFARSGLFLAFNKPKKENTLVKRFSENKNVLSIKNAWFSIEVRNRLLFNNHLRIILAILSTGEIKEDDGRVVVKFNLYTTAKTAGIIKKRKSWSKHNQDYTLNLIAEIADTRYQIINNNKKKGENIGIIEHFSFNDTNYRIRFTKEFTKNFINNILFKPKDDIAKILDKPPLILKLILLALSQKNEFKIQVKNFIQANGIEPTGLTVMRFRNDLKKHKKFLSDLGIEIESDFIVYRSKNRSFLQYPRPLAISK